MPIDPTDFDKELKYRALKEADERVRGTDEQRRRQMGGGPTDAEIVEILATRGMGWFWDKDFGWCAIENGERSISGGDNWNPLADLNAIHDIEKRLTERQWRDYLNELATVAGRGYKSIRHAYARTCAMALAKVLAPERFQ